MSDATDLGLYCRMEAAASALEATGQFASVRLGRGSRSQAPGASSPRAWVAPLSWSERPDRDPDERVKRVRYAVKIEVDEGDGDDPELTLDGLVVVAQTALIGTDFGGCLPRFSDVTEATYPPAPSAANPTPPTLSVVLTCEFAYETDRSE